MSINSTEATIIKRDSIVEKVRRFLFGDDIFISYSRVDSTYALSLANGLTKRNLSCFLDQWGTPPGETLPDELIKTIKKCSTMVLIGSKNAADSENVGLEVKEFLETNRPIIPITFVEDEQITNIPEDFNKQNLTGTLEQSTWYPLIKGIAKTTEVLSALKTRTPSENVILRIVNSVEFRSRSRRLRKTFYTTLGAIIVLLALAGILFNRVIEAKNQAQDNADNATNLAANKTEEANRASILANTEANRAKSETNRANEQANIANTKQKEADKATESANNAKKLADEKNKLALAKTKLADEKTKLADLETKRANEETQKVEQAKIETEKAKQEEVIAKAEANKQQKIGTALQLANNSQSFLKREPEKIIESISFAKDSVKIMSDLGIPSLESDTALRESMALLPNFQDKITFNQNTKISALSPNGKFLAILTRENDVNLYESSNSSKIVKSIPSELILEGTETIAVDNDANYIATSSGRKVRRFCQTCEIKYQDFKVTSSPKGDEKVEDKISALTISPDGNYIAVLLIYFDALGSELPTGNSATIGFWEADRQSEMMEFGEELDMSMHSIAFSSSGNMLAVGGVKRSAFTVRVGSVAIWDLSELKFETLSERFFTSPTIRQIDDGNVTAIAISSNETYATVSDKMTSVWKLDLLNSVSTPLAIIPKVKDIKNISFNSNGKVLKIEKTISDENSNQSHIELEIWDSQGYQEVLQNEFNYKITSLMFEKDDNSLIVEEEYNALYVWDFKKGTKERFDTADNFENKESISAERKEYYLNILKPGGKPTTIVSSFNGRYVGFGYSNGTLKVFEVISKTEMLRLQNDGVVSLIAFDQNNEYIAITVEKTTPNQLDDRHLLKVIFLQPKNLIIEAENRLNKLPKKN